LTVDEGHALSRVLTPGKDSRNDWVPYKHNFAKISKKMRKGCPALQAGRLGAYWTGKIGDKRVVYFKSDSHRSQDTKTAPKAGETLPNEDVWQQIIAEVQPQMVITTGTAGGIGRDCEVGVMSQEPITFDCQKWLHTEPFAHKVQERRASGEAFPHGQDPVEANAGNCRLTTSAAQDHPRHLEQESGAHHGFWLRYVERSLRTAGV
jgi:hypothetical protein